MSNPRIALVTGGARGLGVEIARQLAHDHVVVVGARDASAGARTAASFGGAAWAVQLDVRDRDSVRRAIGRIDALHGRLDVLVNNAAVNFDPGADPLTEDLQVAEDAWQTNVLAPWHLAQTAAPLLRKGTTPTIINVTSSLGSLTRMGASAPAYSISKAALNALTRVLADALRPDGVLVHAVSPGWTATDMGGAGGRPVADSASSVVDVIRRAGSFPSGSFLQDGVAVEW
jgi:NAD(P)-dependent dehydrogenase (short-subunit alcohol dehydrogenase family)